MARPRTLAALAALVAVVWAAPAAGVAPADEAKAAEAASPDAEHFSTGEELARTVTLITGVPISPLLGVSGLGAIRYFRTPEALRPELPWYARPWFWGSGLALVFLFAANTTLGAAVPGLKKPMDFVEEHENKLSALLATPIVLLEGHRLLERAGVLARFDLPPGPHLAEAGLAVAGGIDAAVAPLVQLGLGILSIFCFATVFLAFHVIQVLIAFSPSALLDMLLRAFRVGMLALVAMAGALHPYLGAALGLLLFFFSWLIAAWSFRIMVFGSVISWDFLSGRVGRGDPSAAPLRAFSGKGLPGAPTRSYGELEVSAEGAMRFLWRPWLVLPRRAVELPAEGRLGLRRGAVSPTLYRSGVVREPVVARFPPRFRGLEEGLAARIGVSEVTDGRIVRGFKAAWRALRDLVGGGESANVTP
ncbi:MAG: hypothetical protein KDB94_11880 [Acidobacteria bacterium]|nr:hypothetical protein [Acidobacteriota bacterium]